MEFGCQWDNVNIFTFTAFEFCPVCVYYLFKNITKMVSIFCQNKPQNSILIKLGAQYNLYTL